ncbi:hypothetical protein [Blastococcus brunescens]|uniref:Uncharacterized protein n=1 Tax=Blastococcus brunescens TaxID=1564165 RepID=A0ABZ1B2A9_9ACTN|nr:hypothetical protein [Blastococcus sp. BMG 8361]WRL63484.1 hypothetical protein U6N30_27840 [Blastococcus sp. BMG 8361]
MVLRHLAAASTALVLAAAIGVLAGTFGDDQFWLRAVVFGGCTLAPAYGLGWLVFLSGHTGPDPVARPEETVEHDWFQRSAAGAFLDLVVVAGLGATALAVTGLRIDALDVLTALIVLAFADVAARFTVLRRRDA